MQTRTNGYDENVLECFLVYKLPELLENWYHSCLHKLIFLLQVHFMMNHVPFGATDLSWSRTLV